MYSTRPLEGHRANELYNHAADTSFQSDHATATMSIALAFRMFSKAMDYIYAI